MTRYRNGYVPRDALVSIGSGWDRYGFWEWLLSPATLARHNALVARAFERTGKRLSPTVGYSCYRPFRFQEIYQDVWGIGAATPGKSPHGGTFRGGDSLAIDYGNWADVYDGDREAFYEDCRAVGFQPGVISPANGFPDEPWHVNDPDPWGAVPAFDGAAPFETKEWDEMATEEQVENIVRRVVNERTVGPLSIVPLTTGEIHLFSTSSGGRVHIQSTQHVALLQRVIDNNSNDTLLSAELDIVQGYVRAVNPPAGTTIDTDAIAAKLAEISAEGDAATVKQAVKEALDGATITLRAS